MTLEIARRRIGGIWRTRAAEENGGSQPGAKRTLDLGIVAAADLIDGVVTLYTPEAGEIVGPVYLTDVEFVGGMAIVIGRDEQVDGDQNYPPLAGWDSDLSFDGAGATSFSNPDLKQVPLTTGPVKAGFAKGNLVLATLDDAWQPDTLYEGDPVYDEVLAAGHVWYANPGGTSGSVEPDFAGNIGGTVGDNGITWNDNGAITATGSAHVYADVTIPVIP